MPEVTSPKLFPLFADLRGRRVLVVGGGALARRKVQALLEADAHAVVGAPSLEPTLAAWKATARIEHIEGAFAAHWLDAAWLVIAATDDAATNRAVIDAADARRIFPTTVDDAELARFHLPARLERGPQRDLPHKRQHQHGPSQGSVALVGAGPGDPGLLTLRALRALNEADVILHDRLVSAEVLALSCPGAELIEVGKRVGGDHHATQARIHALLIEHASAGKRVVRLKGGDPFVFGRGGEELEALRAHGIDFEVVPGITAAVACGAYAGIPLTHREHAQSLRLVTAHGKDDIDALDWASLARERQTLAFYMGVAGLERIREQLLAHGLAATTPFALVENGSRREQRVVTGVLAALPALARLHQVRAPALLVIGEVAAFANSLHWFGLPPLSHLPATDMDAASLLAAAA